MTRRWHLEHTDGRRWAYEELAEIVRIDREHDDVWPYEVGVFAVAIGMDSTVYLLDNFMAWHRMADLRCGEDVKVVLG